jgi:CDP-paratose 2-epimerase
MSTSSATLVNYNQADGRREEKVAWKLTERPVLITGGAGFIGTNLASRLLSIGQKVVIFDNLSRPGVIANLHFLTSHFDKLLQVKLGDIRDAGSLFPILREASAVYHFAAQVAVTTSMKSPLEDFEVNARGTLNLLESLKLLAEPPTLLFTSTNKVYGNLRTVALEESPSRYLPRDPEIQRRGINEDMLLNFQSPYGCSKGTADQYVLDYSNSFGLPACVFRMSCIYGMHQWGNEDQGWVAHFVARFAEGRPLTFYGDGKQVRDVLFIDDLVDAMLLAREHIDLVTGKAFNIGGGPFNSVSLLEMMAVLERMGMARPEVRFDEWRIGDQHYYVSDTTRFRQATGWKPLVNVRDGLRRLHNWLVSSSTYRLMYVDH